ncbi:EP300-interacting inhibitor of differentiation 2B-like [Cricetulus griseus]|uniref:EP300-interacting inhibitor of differentiation 2B-like n=1 Tax=Cricetulus griseus TaxID=10029 RepID=A0A9J7GGR7_CRIGR|nr:EP300-interacting inhibitor of differentiation 2B-like [Cricetulus griseus]
MSEPPGESTVPDLSPRTGTGDVPQGGVGGVGGGSGLAEAREGPLAAAGSPTPGPAPIPAPGPGPLPRRLPGGVAAGLLAMPHVHAPLRLLELHEQRMFEHYLHTNPLIPSRLLRDIEERRRLFVEGCRAREAAFDANPPQMDSDARAFTLALTAASDARGPAAH